MNLKFFTPPLSPNLPGPPKSFVSKNKDLLITFTIVVALLITIFILHFESSIIKHPRKFASFGTRNKKSSADPTRLIKKFCKQLKRHESINWNYFYYYENIATKKSLVWCKVPKAASTTLTKMFLRLAGVKEKEITNTTRIHKLLRNYYPRLSSKVMTHRIRTSKTFFIVRDPFERILSAYRDKLESYQRDLEYRDGYYHEHYGKFMTTKNSTRTEPTFSEFVDYLGKTSVARYDEHWMPVTRLCSPCKVNFDMVIRMENFPTEIKKTLNYAKIDWSSLGSWSHKMGTSNKKVVQSYYRNLTLSQVKKLYIKYKRDFQLFGYTPFKYFRLISSNHNSNGTNGNNETINNNK